MKKIKHLEQAQKIKDQLIQNSTQTSELVPNRFDMADSYLLENDESKKSDTNKTRVTSNPIIRNSLAIPKSDYEIMDRIIKRCMRKTVQASRMEIIRAAISILNSQDDEAIIHTIKSLPPAGKQTRKKIS